MRLILRFDGNKFYLILSCTFSRLSTSARVPAGERCLQRFRQRRRRTEFVVDVICYQNFRSRTSFHLRRRHALLQHGHVGATSTTHRWLLWACRYDPQPRYDRNEWKSRGPDVIHSGGLIGGRRQSTCKHNYLLQWLIHDGHGTAFLAHCPFVRGIHRSTVVCLIHGQLCVFPNWWIYRPPMSLQLVLYETLMQFRNINTPLIPDVRGHVWIFSPLLRHSMEILSALLARCYGHGESKCGALVFSLLLSWTSCWTKVEIALIWNVMALMWCFFHFQDRTILQGFQCLDAEESTADVYSRALLAHAHGVRDGDNVNLFRQLQIMRNLSRNDGKFGNGNSRLASIKHNISSAPQKTPPYTPSPTHHIHIPHALATNNQHPPTIVPFPQFKLAKIHWQTVY